MSEPIKVGDLVYVYWTHCPHKSLGVPFTVEKLNPPSDPHCSVCKASLAPGPWVIGRFTALVSQIKRIPPLSELEGEKRDEEITA